MAQQINYFTNSWKQLTSQKGWLADVLLLSLAQLIPIVGTMGLYGYSFEWGRGAAWGIQRSPKQEKLNLSKIMKTGAYAWVFMLVFGLVIGAISFGLNIILSFIPILGSILSIAVSIAISFVTVFGLLCAFRGAIYDNLSASFQVSRSYELATRDWSGLFRVALIYVLGGIIVGVVVTLLSLPLIIMFFIPFITALGAGGIYDTDPGAASALLAGTVGSVGLLIFLVFLIVFVAILLMTVVHLLTIHALGTWLEQFKPGTWGAYNAPVPVVQYAQPVYYQPPASNQPSQNPTSTNAQGGYVSPAATQPAPAESVLSSVADNLDVTDTFHQYEAQETKPVDYDPLVIDPQDDTQIEIVSEESNQK